VSISPHSSAQDFLRWLDSQPDTDQASTARVLLLAAHPDDETIGASALLSRVQDVTVAFLTDGAPHDPGLRSTLCHGPRESYAAMRAKEAACALDLVGIGSPGIQFLGGTDQESIFEVPRLLESLIDLVRDFQPSFVVTHPYEGGHPDHDTAALIAQLCVHLAEQRGLQIPALLEMTSYHARQGKRVIGEFLPNTGTIPELILGLSPEERANKAQMLRCYVSQEAVLSDFPVEPERLRVAPGYDLSVPPHEGTLWYECLNWPITGTRWRETAIEALEHYRHLSCH
jgi:LmbE family N-acetylglucosaminyl deacetylase